MSGRTVICPNCGHRTLLPGYDSDNYVLCACGLRIELESERRSRRVLLAFLAAGLAVIGLAAALLRFALSRP